MSYHAPNRTRFDLGSMLTALQGRSPMSVEVVKYFRASFVNGKWKLGRKVADEAW